jgi:hypothetical protein
MASVVALDVPHVVYEPALDINFEVQHGASTRVSTKPRKRSRVRPRRGAERLRRKKRSAPTRLSGPTKNPTGFGSSSGSFSPPYSGRSGVKCLSFRYLPQKGDS